MGGGIRSNRSSHVGAGSMRHNLKSYSSTSTHSPDTSNKHVFISFHAEDEAQVNLLRQQAKDDRFPVEFTDYSIKEPFDEKWKTQCTERINQSSVVFVMIGPETYQREAVLWEINKAYELGKTVIGIRIYRDENHRIPQPLIDNGAKIIYWDTKRIASELENN